MLDARLEDEKKVAGSRVVKTFFVKSFPAIEKEAIEVSLGNESIAPLIKNITNTSVVNIYEVRVEFDGKRSGLVTIGISSRFFPKQSVQFNLDIESELIIDNFISHKMCMLRG